jgi:Ca2+-binding RTX toxin-like protein
MLWLAGLMGLVAVGSAAFVDVAAASETDDAAGEEYASGRILSGAEGDDILYGTIADDQIGGYAGNDELRAGAGNDEAYGHAGDDMLDGGTGDDRLHGGDGADWIEGAHGDDLLAGHNGDDLLYGGDGADALQGSAGQDVLYGGAGDDAIQGGLGNDTLIGNAGHDTLFGGWGNDVLNGLSAEPGAEAEDQDAQDYLNGGGGDDLILAGQSDIVTSGSGDDRIVAGDWITKDRACVIMDYDAAQDSLLLIWDDSDATAQAPEVSVQVHAEDSESSLIYLGGRLVAEVASPTQIAVGDVTLIALSDAWASGLLPG